MVAERFVWRLNVKIWARSGHAFPRPFQGRVPSVAVRLLIVDDHPVVREGLLSLLQLVPDVEPVGTASDGEQALLVLVCAHVDVVLLDTTLKGECWAAVAPHIKEQWPRVRVLLFTEDMDDVQVRETISIGADGIMLKTAPVPALLEAIAEVAEGRFVVDADLGDSRTAPGGAVLSQREGEVLRLLAAGQSNKEIGLALSVAQATAKRHVENIARKLGASHRSALVAEAFRRGFVA